MTSRHKFGILLEKGGAFMRRMVLTFIMIWLFPIIALAGWEHDEAGAWYENEDGTYKTGWHQDYDGQWYYLDDNTGYVLIATTTPDGYYVNDAGAWIKEGDRGNMDTYNNIDNFEVSAYSFGPSTYKQYGFALPVTVHYNNSYVSEDGVTITINNLGVSQEGALFAEFAISEEIYPYNFNVLTRYIAEDGTYVDLENEVEVRCRSGESTVTRSLIRDTTKVQGQQPVRAEVFINPGSAQ